MSGATSTVADTAGVEIEMEPAGPDTTNSDLVERLVAQARVDGVQLAGEGGLLAQLTRRVLESALEGEITDHLGYDRHDPAGRDGGNSRNGSRAETVLTDVGPVEVAVPRDRDGSFAPKIVRKRQRRLSGVDSMVISLSAKGLTTGEVQAHLAELYGAEVSRQTISTITDKVVEGMVEWQNRPLDPVYPVVFLDAVHVKIRDGKVANRPIYVAMAVTVDGNRDILGLWAGDGGEGAKFWLAVLTELRNRGVEDVCMVVCDGLKGLPEAIEATWPRAVTQTCVIHLIRASFRYAGRQHWNAIAKALRPVYTAPTEQAAKERFGEFAEAWGGKYPAIVRLWDNAWAEFVPFLAFDAEIRKVICSTNAIESVNARIRRAVRARGHFPNEAADASMHRVDFTGAQVRGALLNASRMRGVELVDVEISGELQNVVVNGVDIAPLVDAELNRRMPERARMRPDDTGGFRDGWAILERLWEGTVARARTFPEVALHRSVDDEWSFIQTLRHLNFASAAWVGRMILGNASPWHRLDLPWDEAPGWDDIPWDREARPSLDEVLAVRRERQAMVRHVMESLTDEQLASEATYTEPGWPRAENFPFKECLRIVLNEEWEHRLYAERDLTALEKEN